MRNLLSFVVRGRAQAATAATAAALSSVLFGTLFLVLPPLILLAVCAYFASAAVVALTALRQGTTEAAKVMLGPAIFWALPLLFAAGAGIPTSLFALPLLSTVLGVFVPVILLSAVLRATHSQAIMLTSGAALVAVSALALDLAGADPARWMLQQLRPALEQSAPEIDWSQLREDAESVAPSDAERGWQQGLRAANMLVGLVLTVCLARWWHATVDNPGGFGEEFRAIRLDRRLAALVAALLASALLIPSGPLARLATLLLPVGLAVFLFQGLAVAHAVVRGRRSARAWLTALYVMLIFPHVGVLSLALVIAAGMLDTWFDFRRRWGRGT